MARLGHVSTLCMMNSGHGNVVARPTMKNKNFTDTGPAQVEYRPGSMHSHRRHHATGSTARLRHRIVRAAKHALAAQHLREKILFSWPTVLAQAMQL